MKKIYTLAFIVCVIILVAFSMRKASLMSEKNEEYQNSLRVSELVIEEDQKLIKILEEKNKELEDKVKELETVSHEKITKDKILRYESGGLPAAAPPPPSIVMNPDKKNSGTQRGEDDQENIIVPMDSADNSCATCIDTSK